MIRRSSGVRRARALNLDLERALLSPKCESLTPRNNWPAAGAVTLVWVADDERLPVGDTADERTGRHVWQRTTRIDTSRAVRRRFALSPAPMEISPLALTVKTSPLFRMIPVDDHAC